MERESSPWPLASRKPRPPRCENARNFHSNLLQRIARISQTTVCEEADLDKSAMSRIVSGDRGVMLDELYDFLSALGLAVIECDGEVVSLPEEELASLRYLARKGLGGDFR